jgi:glycolate oxidase FAD binding subunit
LPEAETEATVLVRGLADERAVVAMTSAMGSSCDVSGAAHMPAEIAARMPVAGRGGAAVTALRVEGFAPSVAHRKAALEALLQPFGELALLADTASRELWRAVRDVTPFAADAAQRPLWRVSTAPRRGAALGAALARQAGVQLLYDWAGGLVWVAVEESDDAGAAIVRRAVAAVGGHATLVRAPAPVRAALDVFPPPDAVTAALTKRIKESFDPRRVLNPGRMWAGV